jgi:hypothetical protein
MKKLLALTSLSFLAACGPEPVAQNYVNPGDPERQIDVSSELVTMNLGSRSALSDLSRTLRQDPPTRAELNCQAREGLCAEARSLFANRGIPAEFKGNGDSVTLVYERVVARDCENRYLDNSQNAYNLHPPTFGCSVRANTVQMVSDKQQIVNPSLMDVPDGQKAAQNYGRYQEAPEKKPAQTGSILRTIVTR